MHLRDAAATLAVVTPFVLGVVSTSQPPAAAQDDVVLRFEDPDIVESSGLVALDDRFVTVNDSGDSARVFVVDADTGRTTSQVTWDADPVDLEALAPAGPDAVWVGDIGDNRRGRESVTVTRVALDGSGTRSYQLTYPDGPRDAEALLAHPRTGRLLVVSKTVFGGQVYAAPVELDPDRPNRMVAVGGSVGIVTDGAFLPDGRHLVVRTYSQAVVQRWPSLEVVGDLALPRQEQGEGIAVSAAGQVYVSSEGLRSPLLRVRLPGDLSAALSRAPGEGRTGADGADRSDAAGPPSADAGGPLPTWALGLAGAGVALVVLAAAARASRPPR